MNSSRDSFPNNEDQLSKELESLSDAAKMLEAKNNNLGYEICNFKEKILYYKSSNQLIENNLNIIKTKIQVILDHKNSEEVSQSDEVTKLISNIYHNYSNLNKLASTFERKYIGNNKSQSLLQMFTINQSKSATLK